MSERRGKRLARRLGAGKVARYVLVARDVARLRADQEQLRDRVAFLEGELADVRRRAGDADDAIARLTDDLSAVSTGLTESRRLSLRVAQMTDVVGDRLADSPTSVPQ